MVDFGKETIDLDDEDAVDRIIQCSQAASPFFSVIIFCAYHHKHYIRSAARFSNLPLLSCFVATS